MKLISLLAMLTAGAASAVERQTLPLIPCMEGVVFATDEGRALVRALPDGTRRELLRVEGEPGRGFSLGEAGFACSRDGSELLAETEPRAGQPVRLFLLSAAGAREYAPPEGTRFSGGMLLERDQIIAVVAARGGLGFASIDRASGSAKLMAEFGGERPLAFARAAGGPLRAVWNEASGAVLAEILSAGGAPRILRKLGAVREAAFSPEGDALAWLPYDPATLALPVRALYFAEGQPLDLFAPVPGGWSGLQWSADGTRLLARGWSADRTARLTLHIAEGRRALPASAPLDAALADPAIDGRLAHAAALPRRAAAFIDVLELPSARRLRRIQTRLPSLPGADAVAFSADGTRLFFTRTARRPVRARTYHEAIDLFTVEVARGAPRKLGRMLEREVEVQE